MTHWPSSSSACGSRGFGPQVGSTTRIPFTQDTAVNPPWRPTVRCYTLGRPSRTRRLLWRLVADRTHHPAPRRPCSWPVTPMRQTQQPLHWKSLSQQLTTFSCFQPVILRLWIYGVVIKGLWTKTKENEPPETWLWVSKHAKAPILIGGCKPEQVENHHNKGSSLGHLLLLSPIISLSNGVHHTSYN